MVDVTSDIDSIAVSLLVDIFVAFDRKKPFQILWWHQMVAVTFDIMHHNRLLVMSSEILIRRPKKAQVDMMT